MKIEGYTTDEILALSDEEIDAFAFTAAPLVLRVGTAQILGEFRLTPDRITVELAHIDGGGEGVLPSLWLLTERIATRRMIAEVEWIVHAINCANPNMKLRRVLERRGFTVRDVPGVGAAYYQLHKIPSETAI